MERITIWQRSGVSEKWPPGGPAAERHDSTFCCASQCRRCSLDLSKKVQADLFLQPNKDGLFPGFTQTWRAER
jgi:hypothetical protein